MHSSAPLAAAIDRNSALAGVAACATMVALAALSNTHAPAIGTYVAVLIAGSALTLLALARVRSLGVAQLFAVALALHVTALMGEPAFEDDLYRFVWDGWRTLQTGTPYGVAPEALFEDVAVPDDYAAVLHGVNNAEHPTIYGPLLQGLYAAGVLIGGADPLAQRALFALCNLALVAILASRLPAHQVALYAWSPFAAVEIVLHGHPDGVLALFVAAALALSAARPAWAGVALAMAAGCKLSALAAWPLLLRLPPRALLAACAGFAALYALFLVQGQGAGFESTATFASQWRFNPLAFAVFDMFAPHQIARAIAAALGIGLILWLHVRAPSVEAAPLSLIFGLIVLVSPAVNPWYLLWALPFAAMRKEVWPYAASLVLPLSYLTGLNLENERLLAFQVHPIAWSAEIVLLAGAIAYDVWRARPVAAPA